MLIFRDKGFLDTQYEREDGLPTAYPQDLYNELKFARGLLVWVYRKHFPPLYGEVATAWLHSGFMREVRRSYYGSQVHFGVDFYDKLLAPLTLVVGDLYDTVYIMKDALIVVCKYRFTYAFATEMFTKEILVDLFALDEILAMERAVRIIEQRVLSNEYIQDQIIPRAR